MHHLKTWSWASLETIAWASMLSFSNLVSPWKLLLLWINLEAILVLTQKGQSLWCELIFLIFNFVGSHSILRGVFAINLPQLLMFTEAVCLVGAGGAAWRESRDLMFCSMVAASDFRTGIENDRRSMFIKFEEVRGVITVDRFLFFWSIHAVSHKRKHRKKKNGSEKKNIFSLAPWWWELRKAQQKKQGSFFFYTIWPILL